MGKKKNGKDISQYYDEQIPCELPRIEEVSVKEIFGILQST